MRFLYLIIVGLLFLTSCDNNTPVPSVNPALTQGTSNNTSTNHQVSVLEVIQTTSYTYLRVAENDQEFWIAVGRIDAQVGDIYYYAGGLEMKNFASKELERVFESIYFVQTVTKTPGGEQTAPMASNGSKSIPTDQDATIKIAGVNGGLTIAEIYTKGAELADQKVIVRGKVMKVNKDIMDRNWIHIQDGTSADGQYDLTLTTQEMVAVGDEVTFEGTVGIDKEFGGGYSYALIVEDAVIK